MTGGTHAIVSKASLEGAWIEFDHRIDSVQVYMALPAVYGGFEVPGGSKIMGESGCL